MAGFCCFIFAFLGLESATRVALLVKAASCVSWDLSLPAAFGWGLLFDSGTACWFSIPLIVLLTILPERFFERPWGRLATHILVFPMLFLLLFGLAAEWGFWNEFGTRFNFIAVDYLVYPHEDVDNILESYPVPFLLSLIALLSLTIQGIIWKTGLPGLWLSAASEKTGPRCNAGIVWCIGVMAAGLIIQSNWLPDFANNYNRELGKNGLWSLFATFKDNELDYEQFFSSIPTEQAFQRMKTEIVEDGSILLRPEVRDTLRFYHHDGPELRPNVIQITVESLSEEFLHGRGKYRNLTPNLSALESKSLVFDNFYATGIRTDRGMEALTLSLPSTPGHSIVKRPHNEGLLNWSYPSRFFGHDVLHIDPEEGHALIGNYQKLGHIEDGNFVILKPVRKTVSYHYDFLPGLINAVPLEKDSLEETISYYVAASYLYKHDRYRALTPLEFNQCMDKGKAMVKKK